MLKTPVDQGGLGAREVHIRVLCPPIDKPCHLGINTRRSKELIAAQYVPETPITDEVIALITERIREQIGADSLKYLPDRGLFEAAGSQHFCLGCMIGHQPPVNKAGVANK